MTHDDTDADEVVENLDRFLTALTEICNKHRLIICAGGHPIHLHPLPESPSIQTMMIDGQSGIHPVFTDQVN